jgi:hypothetical protein
MQGTDLGQRTDAEHAQHSTAVPLQQQPSSRGPRLALTAHCNAWLDTVYCATTLLLQVYLLTQDPMCGMGGRFFC